MKFKSLLGVLFLLSGGVFSAHTSAAQPKVSKLKVVTTISVLKAITQKIGGSLVDVSSLSTAQEDPHFIKAKPTFKMLVGQADLFIQVGRSLELWAPQVLVASGNIKLDGDSVINASSGAITLEVPSALSRAGGDIHPQGNPHVWLSPLGALKMAENIRDGLIKKFPAQKKVIENNFMSFKKELSVALFGAELVSMTKDVNFLWRLHEGKKLKEYLVKRKKSVGGWLKLASTIDYSMITYHTTWSYLANEFDLKIFAQIEEKSGVAPSLRYQNQLVKKAKESNVKHIVVANYYKGSAKLINLVAKNISGKKILLDGDCQKGETYIQMMDRILNQLAKFK